MSSFRTIELSDAEFEIDGLRFLTVKTKNLKGRGDICLYVPPKVETSKDLPIYILLHGVYGSAWVWAFKGGAHKTAEKLILEKQIRPAIIAMPSDGMWGDGTGYLPHQQKDFEKWICEDVPTAIQENIPQASTDSQLCIGGLSMGGYGALMLGAKYPSKFKAVSAHSAITKFDQMGEIVEEGLGEFQLKSEITNVIDAMKRNQTQLPALRFDCGTSDTLISANRTLNKQLIDLGIQHFYEEFEGGHEWSYWQKHLSKTLKFFDSHV